MLLLAVEKGQRQRRQYQDQGKHQLLQCRVPGLRRLEALLAVLLLLLPLGLTLRLLRGSVFRTPTTSGSMISHASSEWPTLSNSTVP